jgi:hypothetical protein
MTIRVATRLLPLGLPRLEKEEKNGSTLNLNEATRRSSSRQGRKFFD